MKDEGVIQFHCHWEAGALPTTIAMEGLLHTRNQLYQLGLIGFDTAEQVGYGNISIRASADAFVISGTQTGHIAMLGPEHLSYVTQADIATNSVYCTGPAKASSESLTHAAIYREFATANAVIHVHHHPMWVYYLYQLPTTLDNIGYGTQAMAAEIARLNSVAALSSKKILVMSGHQDGIICFGDSLEAAYALLLQYYHQLPSNQP